ncbi:unnamed protein product [Amaranthus hypochondriacus]
MSFQFDNPNHQTKNKLFGVHHQYHDDDDVIITRVIPITLDLLRIKQSPPQHKFKNLCSVFCKDTSLDFKNKQKRSLEDPIISEEIMSRRNGDNNMQKLDLKLNLSPPSGANPRTESPSRSASVSPLSSCVSSDLSMSSPESSSMVLVGCPRCLMYVMLSEDDPKCPKCKSTVLLDFVHDKNNNNNNNNNHNRNNNNNWSNCGGSSKKTRRN